MPLQYKSECSMKLGTLIEGNMEWDRSIVCIAKINL